MSALSTKDKLKLRLSAAKVERWNRQRVAFASEAEEQRNPRYKDGTLKRCRHLESGQTVVEPETILPDKLDTLYRATDGHKMRLSAGKLTLVRRGDNFSDYADPGKLPAPIGASEKAIKAGDTYVYDPHSGPKTVDKNPDSPFRRAKAKPVVIVRK